MKHAWKAFVIFVLFTTLHVWTNAQPNKNEEEQQQSATSSIQKTMEDSIQWIRDQGQMGAYYYVLFLGIWISLLLPCSIVEIVPGFFYGLKIGFMVSLLYLDY